MLQEDVIDGSGELEGAGELPLVEAILPRRDKINEHLLHDGRDVNIHMPQVDALSWKTC